MQRYSEPIAVVLSECQLFLLVQRCSSPVDNVWTFVLVDSMRPLSEILDNA